jgi:hypothetical protein
MCQPVDRPRDCSLLISAAGRDTRVDIPRCSFLEEELQVYMSDSRCGWDRLSELELWELGLLRLVLFVDIKLAILLSRRIGAGYVIYLLSFLQTGCAESRQ